MCGLTAIYKYSQINDSDIHALELSNSEMRYRGPDSEGVWSDERVGLGHVRLSILGINNGAQPMHYNDELVLVCNGEIYNYIELKEALTKKGYTFSTDSDCEVVMYLYKEYQEKCVDYLQGMFAFALWDRSNELLFGARDHLGQKPLYFSFIEDGIVFSSELKVIKKYFLKDSNLDYSVLESTAQCNYSESISDTYIKEVKKILPGEAFIIKNSLLKRWTYWNKSNVESFAGSLKKAHQRTIDLLEDSIKLQLRSDVPLAVLLSGGIDSSAIAVLAKRHCKDLHAITIGYKGAPSDVDERCVAKKLCKQHGITWHEVELDINDYKDYLSEFIDILDEPNGDIASFAQWGMYKKSRELGFKVLLSGNGGDELFYGYPVHNNFAKSLELEKEMRSFFPVRRKKNMKKFLFFLFNNREKFFKYYFRQVNRSQGLGKAHLTIPKYSNDRKSKVEQVYDNLQLSWLPNNCFLLADKLGLGNSVEIRSPFSDHKLVEFVESLPIEIKFDENISKSFLRDALKNVLPDYILDAEKKGFTPPSSFINEVLKDANLHNRQAKEIEYTLYVIDRYISEVRGAQ
jgi:asparagine synthase (glutamine-hydrolysing)